MRPEAHTQGVNSLQQGLAVPLHLGLIKDHSRHGDFLDVFADVELSQFVDIGDRPLWYSHDELFSFWEAVGLAIHLAGVQRTSRADAGSK